MVESITLTTKEVTYCPQDCITVTLPWLKFGPLDKLLLRTIYKTTVVPNFDISFPRILCDTGV